MSGNWSKKWSVEERTALWLIFTEWTLTVAECHDIFGRIYGDSMRNADRKKYSVDNLRDEYNGRWLSGRCQDWNNIEKPNVKYGNTTTYTTQELAECQRIRRLIIAAAAQTGGSNWLREDENGVLPTPNAPIALVPRVPPYAPTMPTAKQIAEAKKSHSKYRKSCGLDVASPAHPNTATTVAPTPLRSTTRSGGLRPPSSPLTAITAPQSATPFMTASGYPSSMAASSPAAAVASLQPAARGQPANYGLAMSTAPTTGYTPQSFKELIESASDSIDQRVSKAADRSEESPAKRRKLTMSVAQSLMPPPPLPQRRSTFASSGTEPTAQSSSRLNDPDTITTGDDNDNIVVRHTYSAAPSSYSDYASFMSGGTTSTPVGSYGSKRVYAGEDKEEIIIGPPRGTSQGSRSPAVFHPRGHRRAAGGGTSPPLLIASTRNARANDQETMTTGENDDNGLVGHPIDDTSLYLTTSSSSAHGSTGPLAATPAGHVATAAGSQNMVTPDLPNADHRFTSGKAPPGTNKAPNHGYPSAPTLDDELDGDEDWQDEDGNLFTNIPNLNPLRPVRLAMIHESMITDRETVPRYDFHRPNALISRSSFIYRRGGPIVRVLSGGDLENDVMVCDSEHCFVCSPNTRIVERAVPASAFQGLPFVHIMDNRSWPSREQVRMGNDVGEDFNDAIVHGPRSTSREVPEVTSRTALRVLQGAREAVVEALVCDQTRCPACGVQGVGPRREEDEEFELEGQRFGWPAGYPDGPGN